MSVRHPSYLTPFLALVLVPPAPQLSAHQDPNAPVPSIEAHRIAEKPVIDGRLDEPFWEEVPVGTGIIAQRTQEPAHQQTRFRIAYDEEFLYIAVEALDDAIEFVQASERREDRDFGADDFVQIHLDPLHNHRSKYAFFSNPVGTRSDANEGPSGNFNRGWSALTQWQNAAATLPDRWSFEMALPFSMMNYERRDNQTWGFNISRHRRYTDEFGFWSFSPTDYYKPRHFGHITNLDLADTQFSRNWEFSPYVSVLADLNTEDGTDYTVEAGADLSFRLTPAATVALTLNPDFGQVEADAATIALLDTERFLPEKRPFFREGEELMSMPKQLYYSRRFTDITAAAKVTGVYRGHNFFLQNLYGEVTHREESDEGNHLVFRLQHNIGERSSVMGYIADSEMDRGYSRVVGADTIWFFNDDWRVVAQAAVAQDRRETQAGEILRDQEDYLVDATLVYSEYPWFWEIGYDAISEMFDPILSFIPRRDIFGPRSYLLFNKDINGNLIQKFIAEGSFHYYENSSRETTLRDFYVGAKVTFSNDHVIRVLANHDYHAPFSNPRLLAGFELWESNTWRNIDVRAATGEFNEVPYNELIFSKPLKPLERMPIYYDLRVRFEDTPGGETETIWLNQIVFDFFITDEMWIKSSLQHQNDSVHNISVIYGWEFVEDAHFYLVYNDIQDRNSDSQSLFSKLVYTF